MFGLRMLGRAAAVVAISCVCLIAVGCGSKVNDKNFGKIKAGMSETEVLDILGTPNSTDKTPLGASKEVWEDGNKKITVLFVENKVLASEKSGF